MATNGILDIQETTEDFRDPDMEFGPDDMMDIKKTLQIVGVPPEQHGEFAEEFRIWKQNNNGTFDMFLEEKYQLPPGTITKIKTEQQVATGPEDALTEEDMIIQPGSGDMLEIMQSVGAPQRAGLGGRIGYQAGEQVLPMPRPTDEDPRASFFKQMGAMPEQTLLRQHQPMKGQVPEGIMGQTPDPFGGLLGGEEGDIGQGGQPLVEYEHEGAEQPPSWFDRMRTGTYDGSQDHSIDMETIIDFLKKMGMAITKENIAKAAKALGMAMKFGPLGIGTGLGIAGLKSLGAPEEIEETEVTTDAYEGLGLEPSGFQEGGEVMDKNEWALMLFQKPYDELTTEQQYELDTFKPGKAAGGVIRQKYGIGSLVKSITGGAKKLLKSAKKILKSDLGKMAMLYIGTAGFANIGAQGWSGAKWAKPLASKGWLRPTQIYGNIGTSLSNLANKLGFDKVIKPGITEGSSGLTVAQSKALTAADAIGDADAAGAILNAAFKNKAIPQLTKKVAGDPAWYKGALPWIGGASVLGGLYTAKNPGEEQFDMGKRDAEVDDITKWLASIQPASDIDWPYPDYAGAKGGRVGYANGGILDIEEVDLRDNGGFMPLGKKEKADDVPALLSKNEFVFTADAVKSAGEGDPEVGAERMQNVMKNLEAGGKISEESQGLKGARDMFEISERLSEAV